MIDIMTKLQLTQIWFPTNIPRLIYSFLQTGDGSEWANDSAMSAVFGMDWKETESKRENWENDKAGLGERLEWENKL